VMQLPEGSAVMLGIRPRNLELCSESMDDSLSATIDLIEPMGAETLAHLREGEHDVRVVTHWKTSLTEGSQVHARFPAHATQIFHDGLLMGSGA